MTWGMGAPGLAIRPYRDADRGAVIALFRDAMDALAPPEQRAAFDAYVQRAVAEELGRIETYYGREGCAFWVAERGAVVGTTGVERRSPGVAELRRMIVSAPHRRQGVARALLATAEAFCAAAGYQRIALSTSELQRPAMTLYASCGYALLGSAIATTPSHKRVGIGLRQYEFEKVLPRRG